MDDGETILLTRRSRSGWAQSSWAWLFLGLTGCAAVFGEDVQPPCPQAITIADAQNITAHQPGPGRDLTDVLVNGSIVRIATSCEYDGEGRVDTTVYVELDLSIGPAAQDNTGQWRFFILVTDPDRKFVAKRIFSIDLKFEQAVFRTRIQEQVQADFAYAPWEDASNFLIFVGFQLTRDQLDYLRSLKR